jgi:hypothetical protein
MATFRAAQFSAPDAKLSTQGIALTAAGELLLTKE